MACEAAGRAYVESAAGQQTLETTAAEAFLYLASPVSSCVTGTWLDITGGVLVR